MALLEDVRQEEIKGELIYNIELERQFILAKGIGAKLKQDEDSKKWFYKSDSFWGVGDSPEKALSSLWENFHSENHEKIEF